jgi:hypothetical protein
MPPAPANTLRPRPLPSEFSASGNWVPLVTADAEHRGKHQPLTFG